MIHIKNLKFNYKTFEKSTGFFSLFKDFFFRKYITHEALNINELNINEGEIIGLLGPNGAGKTTLIKILTGILEKKDGQITCNGFYPYKKEKEYLKNIGVVMGQKSQLIWDLPSIETLKMLKDIYEISDEDFNERLENFLNLFNLKEKLNTPVRKLSLGERLKFDLICALIHKPKILFLDEPTIGVDIVSQKSIYDFLNKINKTEKTTILLTSHYIKDIESLCSRIVVIIKGKINIDTNINALKAKYKVERKYIIETKNDEFKIDIENIKWNRIEKNKFEVYLDNVINITNNTKELDEIIYDIFKEV